MDLKQFFDFIEIKDSKELNEINHHILRSWIVFLSESDLENKSINRKLASLRTFFKWCLKQELIIQNPSLKIRGPKQTNKLPTFIKESELSFDKFHHNPHPCDINTVTEHLEHHTLHAGRSS